MQELVKKVDQTQEQYRDLCKEVQQVKFILVGVDGNNGIRSNVKDLKQSVEHLEKWKTQSMAVFAIIQIFVVPIIITLLVKQL